MNGINRISTERLPNWLQGGTEVSLPEQIKSKRGRVKSRYTAKLLLRATAALELLLEEDSASRGSGWLQSVGDATRLMGAALLLMAAAVTASTAVLAVMALTLVSAALLSKVRLNALLFRVTPVVLFTALVFAPVLFTVGTVETADSFLSFSIFGTLFNIVPESIHIVSVLLLRVTVMVLVTALLLLTTTRTALFCSLRILPLLSGFVTLLQMTYRHLLILISHVQESVLARQARTVGQERGRDLKEWFASRVGLVLMRSLATAEEVSQAMVSRGFNGTKGTRGSVRFFRAGARARAADALCLLVSFFLFFIALGV